MALFFVTNHCAKARTEGSDIMKECSQGSEWRRWDLHLHTKSSYDYKYKGSDADAKLCDALKSNNIKAVAITDHFVIDKDEIRNLRELAPDIVFFPGVELRTDKGSDNLHVILIFSDQENLDNLSADFDAIMLRKNAKSKESNETIYWTFEDICNFAKSYNALISVHAGRKTNGIDKEITNAIPVNEAIKADIADNIDFFEIGQKRDIDDYEKHVFKEVKRKPLIMCSDCHSPVEYSPKESLWIKADLTFEGLKQCLYQPLERVFIGVTPPMLDRLEKDKQANIASISAKRIDSPSNPSANWFNFDMPLNSGLVAIIGNKGSGKSAFSDIIGHLCKCRTMNNASFLNDGRFRKPPKNYAKDYDASLTWADGKTSEDSLDKNIYDTTIEDAQYLPQKYIEEVCNDIGNVFQSEINKVIFSYVDRSERGEALNLEELVKQKSKPLELSIQADLTQLESINTQIIKIESKKTEAYKRQISDSLKKAEDTLERHEKSKPIEVKKPQVKDEDTAYQENLQKINDKIAKIQKEIADANLQIAGSNSLIDETNTLLAQIELLESKFDEIYKLVSHFMEIHEIDESAITFTFQSPRTFFQELINKEEAKKKNLQDSLNDPEKGLTLALQKLTEEKAALISTADGEEKIYQKYLSDLAEWEDKKKAIIGDADTESSLEYFRHELKYITTQLEVDYSSVVSNRDAIAKKLYGDKTKLVEIYQTIYTPVQDEITALLGNIEDNISFKAEIYICDPNLESKILGYINQKYSGKFKGQDGTEKLDRLIRGTDFSDLDSVIEFVHKVSEAATEDIESSEKKISDKQGFYDYIYGLSYIDVSFKLKMDERNLDELSPGERGIVLLIFYLALSKESKPIIIDQPEDNLDNQSVYGKLVPCICKAKQRRQVIIVTHNPNIAVACDAEQIIYCSMDKSTCEITYTSGAIENPDIRAHVVDVLEGTMPAFELRRQKYE